MNPLQEQKYFIPDISKIPLPKVYKDEHNETRNFQNITDVVKNRLERLLTYVSPYFIYDETIPSLTCKKIEYEDIELLDFTNKIVINNKGKLLVNGIGVQIFWRKSCSLITYHTYHFPEIICIEELKHNKIESCLRSFLVKLHDIYRLYTLQTLPPKIWDHSLFAQIPVRMYDSKIFYLSQPFIAKMSNDLKLDKDAIKIKKPVLIQYRPRAHLNWFIIANHTREQIIVDIHGNLSIGHEKFAKYNYRNNCCHFFIAHTRKSVRKSISILHQNDSSIYYPKASFSYLNWKQTTKINANIFTNIHKIWILNTLWAGLSDKRSFIYKIGISKDTLIEIIVKYFYLQAKT
jgi:hypothetical protein